MKKENFWHEVELQRKISPLKFVIMPFVKEIVVSLIVFCLNRNRKSYIACKKDILKCAGEMKHNESEFALLESFSFNQLLLLRLEILF